MREGRSRPRDKRQECAVHAAGPRRVQGGTGARARAARAGKLATASPRQVVQRHYTEEQEARTGEQNLAHDRQRHLAIGTAPMRHHPLHNRTVP